MKINHKEHPVPYMRDQVAKAAHRRLVHRGELLAARAIMPLILRGRVVLGLSDEAWEAEQELYRSGLDGKLVGRDGSTIRFETMINRPVLQVIK